VESRPIRGAPRIALERAQRRRVETSADAVARSLRQLLQAPRAPERKMLGG